MTTATNTAVKITHSLTTTQAAIRLLIFGVNGRVSDVSNAIGKKGQREL
jgi:hypothetical protein